MDILEVVKKAKHQYDKRQLKRAIERCNLPPGCQAKMRLGTGILEIVCESEDLVCHVWRKYQDYLPIEVLTMERLWIRIEGENSRTPVSLESLLAARKSREDAEKFLREEREKDNQ